MLGVLALVWNVAVAATPVNADCPRQEEVAAELDRLGASAALATLGSPEVTVAENKMRVALRGRDGSVIGAREVAASEDCHQRAAVAAVFIAAWVGEWSTPLPRLPPPSSGEGPPVRAAATPLPPLPPPESAVPRTPSPPVPPEPPKPSQPASHPPAPSRPKAPAPVLASDSRPVQAPPLEVAGWAFGTHDGDAGTFGAAVSAAYRFDGATALAALFETTGERESALGPGFATYRTARLGIGASLRKQRGHLFADAGLFPELTMLSLAGNGQQLDTTRSATTWGASMDLRGRVGFAAERFLPFLFAGGSVALRAEHLTLDGSQASSTLSRWNLSAGAGLAFLLGGNE